VSNDDLDDALLTHVGFGSRDTNALLRSLSTTHLAGNWWIMTLEDEPRIYGAPGDIRVDDLMRIRDFIVLNKETLLKYWEHDDSPDGIATQFSLKKLE
jgi:hypothetical protein